MEWFQYARDLHQENVKVKSVIINYIISTFMEKSVPFRISITH